MSLPLITIVRLRRVKARLLEDAGFARDYQLPQRIIDMIEDAADEIDQLLERQADREAA